MPENNKPSAEKITSLSCSSRLLEDFEKKVIKPIRKETGIKLTRSGIFQIFMKLCIDSMSELSLEKVYDSDTLKEALKKAMGENIK